MDDYSIEYSAPTEDDKARSLRQTALYTVMPLFKGGDATVDDLIAAARRVTHFVTNG